MKLNISNSFFRELPADPITENKPRQVLNAAFSYVQPKTPSQPKLIHIAKDLANQFGFSAEDISSKMFRDVFTGSAIYPDTKPYAMCYGGHQFGHWAGQLGDGRAINLFEALDAKNQRWQFQLKGAGLTPYSRTADGLAVLRSSIREHLCSEAMHHLGVPTTRSLSLSLTGDEVLRDVLYDGNPAYELGAVVCRVAPSFIRFGNFEIFAARNDTDNLKRLTDYTITNFFPNLNLNQKEVYLNFFQEVCSRTFEMIVHWERVGFVHGVMNTDNMSILGLTIDYGPYGWLEPYDLNWTPNTTDLNTKRYRFGNQAQIALWNLLQLANALYLIIPDANSLESILHQAQTTYKKSHFGLMKKKLGLFIHDSSDSFLIDDLKGNLKLHETDYTIFFRLLSKVSVTDSAEQAFLKIKQSFYDFDLMDESLKERWYEWLTRYRSRMKLEQNTDSERSKNMNQVNPKYVFRNYMAHLAIEKANKEDYSLIESFYQLFKKPYDEQAENEEWFQKRPDWAREKVGCSMLSCSS